MTQPLTSKFSVFVPIEPRPASRPNVSRYGVRYSKNHTEYQQRFKAWLKDGAQTTFDWPYIEKQLCSVTVEFVSTKARTSKLTTPPYDIDNASKLILDCITTAGLIWYDDKTIVHLDARKRFAKDGETAGTYFTVKLED